MRLFVPSPENVIELQVALAKHARSDAATVCSGICRLEDQFIYKNLPEDVQLRDEMPDLSNSAASPLSRWSRAMSRPSLKL